MNKKPFLFAVIFVFVVSFGFSQRNLQYSIDNEGSLVVGGSSFVHDRYDIKDHPTLQTLVIEPTVEGRKVVGIAKQAFYNDSYLVSVSIPESVEYIGPGAFSACRNIKEFYISPDNPRYEVFQNLIIDKLNHTLVSSFGDPTEITVPEGLTEIPERFFPYSENLKKVNIPDSVTRIGERAFYKMYYIESLNIPKNIEYIGDEAFFECWALTGDLYLPDTLTYLGTASFVETKITSARLPEHFTSIPDSAFLHCENLKDLTLPKKLKSIGTLSLCGCSLLVDFQIPDTVDFIGKEAFRGLKFNVL